MNRDGEGGNGVGQEGGDGGGGNGEEEMGSGAMGREGKEVSQADGMPGWNEVTVFSDFAYSCNAGYPS